MALVPEALVYSIVLPWGPLSLEHVGVRGMGEGRCRRKSGAVSAERVGAVGPTDAARAAGGFHCSDTEP